jgi:hypothetical protein
MEVWVTGYNFESWPFKDHSCHVCFKLAYWFQWKTFLNIFPIGSYVKTMSAGGRHLGWRSGSQDIILKVYHLRTIHAMTYWFQRRRLLNIFSIGSNVKTKSSHGGHLEFPISKRFTSLVQDHPFQFTEHFLTRRIYNFDQSEHIMGPGSHVEFPISTKNN